MPEMTPAKLTDAELTRLAATELMGWTVEPYVAGFRILIPADNHFGFALGPTDDQWKPLSDWRAAGDVLDKMSELGWVLFAKKYPNGDNTINFCHKDFDDPTAPEPAVWIGRPTQRAITIAALIAVGAITEDQL